MVRWIEGLAIVFGRNLELGGYGELFLFLPFAICLQLFDFGNELFAQPLQAHFLNVEIAKLALISEIGSGAEHGEAGPRIKLIGHFGG